MRTVRAVLHRGSAPRLVLIVLGALALIVGILAMHTLASDMGHDMGSITTMAAGPAHASMPGAPESGMPTALVSAGSAMHGGMTTCVLALLDVLLLVAIPSLLGRLRPVARPQRSFGELLAVLAVPRPPSLTALSISRT